MIYSTSQQDNTNCTHVLGPNYLKLEWDTQSCAHVLRTKLLGVRLGYNKLHPRCWAKIFEK